MLSGGPPVVTKLSDIPWITLNNLYFVSLEIA